MPHRCLLFIATWTALTAMLAAPCRGYIADDRWTVTATNGPISGVTGNPPTPGVPVTLTWSFVPDGTAVPGNSSGTLPSNLISFLDATFGAGPGGSDYTLRPWFHIFQESYARLEALSGVTYVYEPHDDGVALSQGNAARGLLGVRGDVRLTGKSYGDDSNILASNYGPDFSDMMINTDKGSSFKQSFNNYVTLRNTVMHESMHGLGIQHVDSSTSNFLIEPILGTSFDGPQLDDLLAIQRLYGDVYEKNGGNDSAATATALGAVSAAQPRSLGSLGSTVGISASQTDFLSIDDDSDTDFFSFTISSTYNVRLSVTPRGATYSVGPQGGVQSSFNSLAVSNLSLALIGSDGTSTVKSVDVTNAGSGEAILRDLDPGTYYARVKGAQNNIQLYQIMVSAAPSSGDNLFWVGGVDGTWDVNGTDNFYNGTSSDLFRPGDNVTFGGAGKIRNIDLEGNLEPLSMTVDSGSYTLGGAGHLISGSVTVFGGGELVLANSGNTYSGPTTVTNGTVRITGDANAMVSPITIGLDGTMVLDASDAASMGSTIDIQSGGVLEVGSLVTEANVLPDHPAGIINNGLIRVYDSEVIRNVSGGGQVVVANETSQFADNPSFAGQIEIDSAAVVQPITNDGLGNEQASTLVQSGGSVQLNSSLELPNNFTLNGDGGGSGALRVGSGVQASFTGAFHVPLASVMFVASNATAAFTGAIDAPTSGVLTLQVENGGEARFNGPIAMDSGGIVKRGGGIAALLGNYASSGLTHIQEGTLQVGSAGQLAGEFRIDAGAELNVVQPDAFASTAELSGSGTVVGDLNYSGVLAPGDSFGQLTIAGNLSLSAESRITLEIGGLTPIMQFDQLQITASATLGGDLEVLLAESFSPMVGDSFALIAASEITQQFSNVLLPQLIPGMTWDLTYQPNQVLLSVSAAPVFAAADFDIDGDVDDMDLSVWQANIGLASAGHSDGDANGDGVVDGSDFLAWQRELYGPPAAATTANVPEPATGLQSLTVIAALAISFNLNRQRP